MKNFKSFVVMVLLITFSIFYATPVIGTEISEPEEIIKEVPITSIILRTIEVYLDGQIAPLNYAAFIK